MPTKLELIKASHDLYQRGLSFSASAVLLSKQFQMPIQPATVYGWLRTCGVMGKQMPQAGAPWNIERLELLFELWQQGLSAMQIAERLGGVTRNAVIGKAHRVGLGSRPSPIRHGGSKSRKKRLAKREQLAHGRRELGFTESLPKTSFSTMQDIIPFARAWPKSIFDGYKPKHAA